MTPRRPFVRVGCLAASAVALAACVLPGDGQPDSVSLLSEDGAWQEGSADGLSAPIGPPARIWYRTADLSACGLWTEQDDFSSGRYNLHRYEVDLPTGGPVVVRLQRTSGDGWHPALVVVDQSGSLIFDGEQGTAHADVSSSATWNGRDGDLASVVMDASARIGVNVYVTGWQVLDSGLAGSLPAGARYDLSIAHECRASGSEAWGPVHGGIDRDGSSIPRAGLRNSTLRSYLGVATEPYGSVVSFGSYRFVSGRVSWFGGPQDTGVTSRETGAITGERLRSLNDPLYPSAAVLASRPEDYYFAAMRFDYGPNGVSFWADVRLLVVNPRTGAAIVVRPVDWGPNTRTRRVLDLSPQSMADLTLVTDDEAYVSFAAPGTPLGVVR